MCLNNTCTIKQDCLRNTAKPNEFRQSYSSFKEVDGDCEYFMSNKGWSITKKGYNTNDKTKNNG